MHAHMDSERIADLVAQGAAWVPVPLRAKVPDMCRSVPQAGLHLTDLPKVLVLEIFHPSIQFVAKVDPACLKKDIERKVVLEAFRFVDDLLTLRLVTLGLSRRFKAPAALHSVRRAIHANLPLHLQRSHRLSHLACFMILKTIKGRDEQGAMALSYAKTYQVSSMLELFPDPTKDVCLKVLAGLKGNPFP